MISAPPTRPVSAAAYRAVSRRLAEIDRFFDEHARDGQAVQGGLLAEDTGRRLFALGAYVGEAIRQRLGGDWMADDDDPAGEVNVMLRLPDGTVIWPVQRAFKRLINGPEDGIVVYGAAFGLTPMRVITPGQLRGMVRPVRPAVPPS
jgi:hypothetical protein